jgi:uncharacterized RDD family membrane protein YckC
MEHCVPSIRRRLAAMLYEVLLLAAVLAVVYVLPLTVAAASNGKVPSDLVLRLYLLVVTGLYFMWQWRQGQTLAMRTWGFEVVSAQGGRASWAQLLLRYGLAWPSIGCLGAGLFWALFDAERQFLHDRLAGTRLVRISASPPTPSSPPPPAGRERSA